MITVLRINANRFCLSVLLLHELELRATTTAYSRARDYKCREDIYVCVEKSLR